MSNQSHLDYAKYNIWANDRIIHKLLSHSDEILTKPIVASFPTIRETILHIWFAETGWLSRLQGHGWNSEKVDHFTGSTAALFEAWQQTSRAFMAFTNTADLEQEIQFEQKGTQFSIPSREIVHTVMNHGSFHRGQIIMMMRQLDITDIAQTDYIEWVREKERGNIL